MFNMYNTSYIFGKHVSIAIGVNQILRNSAFIYKCINSVVVPPSVNAVAKFHRNMKRKKSILLVLDRYIPTCSHLLSKL